MSPWLVATIAVGCVYIFGLVLWEHHVPGGSLYDAFMSFGKNGRSTLEPAKAEVASAIVLNLGLIWFTFFSGNKRVTRDDKYIVTLMVSAAALSSLLIVFHHFFRQ
jgi:hypothetical protein